MNLIEQTGGRNRFCHQHSGQYVSHLITGKPVPFKRYLTEADMTSRRAGILFQKLWRYIEAKGFAVGPGQALTGWWVERTAFDLLAGTRRQRSWWKNKDISGGDV